MNTYTFKQIKTYLQQQPAICFKELEKEDIGGLKTFLSEILSLNNKYSTVFADSLKLQTAKCKRRSIGDLYRITYFYFPKVALITIYKSLLEQIYNKTALSAICQATGMRVYRHATKNETCFFNGEAIDEFHVDISLIEGYDNVKKGSLGHWGYEFTQDEIKFISL